MLGLDVQEESDRVVRVLRRGILPIPPRTMRRVRPDAVVRRLHLPSRTRVPRHGFGDRNGRILVISYGVVNIGPEDFSTSPTVVAESAETKNECRDEASESNPDSLGVLQEMHVDSIN